MHTQALINMITFLLEEATTLQKHHLLEAIEAEELGRVVYTVHDLQDDKIEVVLHGITTFIIDY